MPGATIVNEKTILNEGRGSAWQKTNVDAYISDGSGYNAIGFQIDEYGNYKLVGDFAGQRNFEKNFSKEFLEQKIETIASTSLNDGRASLVNKYTNPNNAKEVVYEYETY